MTPAKIMAMVEIMRANCLTYFSMDGVSLTMDARGFVVQPVQTMPSPPQPVSPEVEALFKPLTDEELLTAHLPPEDDK